MPDVANREQAPNGTGIAPEFTAALPRAINCQPATYGELFARWLELRALDVIERSAPAGWPRWRVLLWALMHPFKWTSLVGEFGALTEAAKEIRAKSDPGA